MENPSQQTRIENSILKYDTRFESVGVIFEYVAHPLIKS